MSNEHPLQLDAATMRRLGYRVVDLLVERIAGLDGEPAWRRGDRASLDRAFREAAPEQPGEFEELLGRLTSQALTHGARVDHPRFLGFVPGAPTWPGVLGDLIAAGYNVFQGSWLGGSGASAIELVVLDWFKDWIGYPARAEGLFTSGGSAANLMAIACARQTRFGGHEDRAVLYLSSECHSSLERAARVLGFRPERVRKLPVDAAFRFDTSGLEAAIAADRAAGLEPFMVLASAGSTGTGAVDPLTELTALCRARGLWLHIDAAYGGFAVLTDRGRELLEGIGDADSITIDPHKWLFQPFEAGCLLVREPGLLETAFRVLPDYLQDAAIGGEPDPTRPVNFMDRGIQLTRSARAIKVWLSVQFFGLRAFRQAIDAAIDLAARAEHRLRASGRFEILSPATLGIVCFRRCRDGDGQPLDDEAILETWNAALVRDLADSGLALISSTRVDGRYALRFCILSPRTSWTDIERTIAWLESADPANAAQAKTSR